MTIPDITMFACGASSLFFDAKVHITENGIVTVCGKNVGTRIPGKPYPSCRKCQLGMSDEALDRIYYPNLRKAHDAT